MNPVLKFFTQQADNELTSSQKDFILSAYKKEHFTKKTVIFREGDTNTRHYIIEKGLLRLYLIDAKGKEINVLFARENQVIGDLTTPKPTSFYLETTEESIVYSIQEEGIQNIMATLGLDKTVNPSNKLRRSYIKIQQRLVSILSKTAEENYLDFQNQYPDLLQRLPQYHIASYLGISAEFLSKIIAKTSKK